MSVAFEAPCGPILASPSRGVLRASGIRYARAARFGPPVPEPDHREPLLAATAAPACPQTPSPALDEVLGSDFSVIPQSEDCLRLSVSIPEGLAPGERVPVMVWIHGGSYVSGCGDIAIMDPRPLVAEQRVIAVTVTYRLGLLGFLGDPDGGTARPAQLGLLDIRVALRWVRRNIEAFGGDPERITAFGQSAGADAIAHLMTLPEAPELFSRAIIQSAPLGIRSGRAPMSRAMFEACAELTAATPLPELLERQSRVTTIGSGFGLPGMMPFGCQYGLEPLPAEERVPAAWEANAPRITVLVGHTSEEARLFLPAIPALARAAAIPVIGPLIRRIAVSALTGRVYGAPSRALARRHAAAGGAAHHYVIPWAVPGNPFGAAHTIDLPLLFGDREAWASATLLTGVEPAALDTAGRGVRAIWGAFARGEDLGTRGGEPGAIRYRRA